MNTVTARKLLFREGLVIKPKQTIVERAHESWKHTLVGRLHSDVPNVCMYSLIHVIKIEWTSELTAGWAGWGVATTTTTRFTIRNLGHGILSFTFQDEKDKQKIMNLRPWEFFENLLVLVEWRPNISNPTLYYDFTTSPFWIQAHDIPPELRCEEIGMEVGKVAGEVLEVECDDIVEQERDTYHARIRVNVDITKRLALGCWLYMSEDNILWVSFRYEGLPKICYKCGVLGHIEKKCKVNVEPLIENYVVYGNGKKPKEGEVVRDMSKRGYGPWVYAEHLEELNLEGEGAEPLFVRVEEEEEELSWPDLDLFG